MKKVLLILFLIFHTFSFGQLVGNCNAPFDTPEGLVEILVGEGVEFSNATFSGFIVRPVFLTALLILVLNPV